MKTNYVLIDLENVIPENLELLEHDWIKVLLFDEAFYGIDAARRDQLLAFADALGLQLFVSSPDQDGVKREIRHSVSLIVVKDENLDVHLTPVVWRNVATQGDLLGGDAPEVGMTVKEETR